MKISTIFKSPSVGDAATIAYHSDCDPATVIHVLSNGRRIVLQKDKATRIDNNGMSECQIYEYEPDPDGTILVASLRKDGNYKLIGGKTRVHVGSRRKFHDYSF
jgi:hypothetical protein